MKNVHLLASIAAGSFLLSATALAQEVDKKAERACPPSFWEFGSDVDGSRSHHARSKPASST